MFDDVRTITDEEALKAEKMLVAYCIQHKCDECVFRTAWDYDNDICGIQLPAEPCYTVYEAEVMDIIKDVEV